METQKTQVVARAATLVLLAACAGASAVPIAGQGTWETTLQARDLDSNGVVDAYYDTALNISWLANANAAAGTLFDTAANVPGVGNATSTDTDGRMTWGSATAWTSILNVNGVEGWRLPTTIDVGAPGCDWTAPDRGCEWNVDPATSEMAHMFYVSLGNNAGSLSNTGAFVNLTTGFDSFWSNIATYPNSADIYAWYFNFQWGSQGTTHRTNDYIPYRQLAAWAVHDGDVGQVTPVPEPTTHGLMLAGLAALGWGARRGKKDAPGTNRE